MLEILATLMMVVFSMGIIASALLFYVCYKSEKSMKSEKETNYSRFPQ